jgi:hypothetical protein
MEITLRQYSKNLKPGSLTNLERNQLDTIDWQSTQIILASGVPIAGLLFLLNR